MLSEHYKAMIVHQAQYGLLAFLDNKVELGEIPSFRELNNLSNDWLTALTMCAH